MSTISHHDRAVFIHGATIVLARHLLARTFLESRQSLAWHRPLFGAFSIRAPGARRLGHRFKNSSPRFAKAASGGNGQSQRRVNRCPSRRAPGARIEKAPNKGRLPCQRLTAFEKGPRQQVPREHDGGSMG